MEEGPPPTDHVLRPHHVGILAIFMLTFKDGESRNIPPPFLLHIYRVLLNEVSEVARPKAYHELLHDLSSGPKADVDEPRKLLSAFKGWHKELQTPDQLTDFFRDLPALFVAKTEDDLPILMRRSIFGYFCRRCFFSFIKLSFSGVVKLQKDYQGWCAGESHAGYELVQKDQLNNDTLIFKTQADKKTWAQPESYAAWERGQATGDENIAVENLRRFFEQHFHENNDSGFRQHALLNLVRMHYTRQEYAAARKLLQEAIAVARTSNDKLTLQHCISMLHRLPPTEPGRKPVLNEIQPHLHPLEVLFDVTKLMQIHNGQPLSASFEKIVQAAGLYDHWADTQAVTLVEAEQWGHHAVQSIVWSAAGFDQLAAVEEDIVTTFTEVGGEDNNCITVTINRAYKRARQGKYEEALAILLEPDVWRGITIDDYVIWANEIWHILALRASRRGQERQHREFLRPRRPSPHYNPREYFFNESSNTSMIRDELYEVMQMRKCGQATSFIEQLLTALWHSEFQCRFGLYRTGIILLADVGLEFGMTKRSRRILEEIMPQMINGDDLEQRGFGCFVLARCIIASGKDKESLQEALPYLLISETDYTVLEIYRSLKDVQYLLSVVYHNLGREHERDEAVKRHFATDKKQKMAEVIVVEEEINRVWQVVTEVGAALAAR